MCDAPATGVEHVPPVSFYPKGRRGNLFTVPACERHNEDNAKDVEYVRNFIVSMNGTNEVAAELFDTAQRSYDRSPALFARTFRGFRVVGAEGAEQAAVRMDFARLENVVKAIACALYYRDNGSAKFVHDWRVFSPTLRSAGVLFDSGSDQWAAIREKLAAAAFINFPVPDPNVFQYGVHVMADRGFVFKFTFYEGFIVYAWTRLPPRPPN